MHPKVPRTHQLPTAKINTAARTTRAHCREHGEVPLTPAAMSVRSEEGKTTTLWGTEASSTARSSPRIALCCGWQVAGTGCSVSGEHWIFVMMP
jgi:hypothetical protein